MAEVALDRVFREEWGRVVATLIAVTDDWNHRVVLIDRKTKKIVWQYGHDHQPGSAPGYLNKPDGLDLIP